MCGIVGYIGSKSALPIVMDGLKRLEYRGYDSAGVALICDNKIQSIKSVGKISNLESKIATDSTMSMFGHLAIGHTRWATHGKPTEENAHPHKDCTGSIWVVHNGIIENYQGLKKYLEKKGHTFISETDTEVLSHLIEDVYEGDITKAVMQALKSIMGAYGIVVMHSKHPGMLIAARQGSPLVIGVGDTETIIASDVSALLQHTNEVVYLNDGEVAVITGGSFEIKTLDNRSVDARIHTIEWDIEQAERGGYPHFLLKEIFEQPATVMNSMRGRCMPDEGKAKLGGLERVIERIRDIQNLKIVACGTAAHAGMIGRYMLEEYAGIPTSLDFASELRYRETIWSPHTAVLAISQSGETADTLAALREGKEKGALALGIVNVVGSTIARETDAGVYNHIGPEISVASTKAFTSQVTILALMTTLFGRQRKMSTVIGQRIMKELQALPGKINEVLTQTDTIRKVAARYADARDFAFMGRKYNYPVALEGALKLREISYIHAEGFASGEMKHGSIAMIDESFPSLCIAPQDSVYEKNISNIQEIKARGGKVIAITTAGNVELANIVDDVIYIPKTLEILTPILSVIPLQLFAYYFGVHKGLDVDKPRNLAKSVTVE